MDFWDAYPWSDRAVLMRRILALRLLLLQRRQVDTEILDPFSHRNFVIVIHGAEDGSPYWHVGRTMRQDTSTKTQHIRDVLVWEFAAVAFGERGQIRRRCL